MEATDKMSVGPTGKMPVLQLSGEGGKKVKLVDS
jgi:hypothetical protein